MGAKTCIFMFGDFGPERVQERSISHYYLYIVAIAITYYL